MSYRESHKAKGHDYHSMFETARHTAVMWELEKTYLPRLVAESFPEAKPRHLDFACGTGRILSLLAPHTSEQTGVDVSASMLEVARVEAGSATIVEGDLTREQLLAGQEFDLVTAFRFFPNAEPELRKEVILALQQALAPSGIVIFNNHMNESALARKGMRLFGKGRGHTMTEQEVLELADTAGLKLKTKVGLGLLPFNDRFMPLPSALAAVLERGLTKMHTPSSLAHNILYVFERNN